MATHHRRQPRQSLPPAQTLVGFYQADNQTDWNNFTKSGASGGIGLTPTVITTYLDLFSGGPTWANMASYASGTQKNEIIQSWIPTAAQGCVPLNAMFTAFNASANGTAQTQWTAVTNGTHDTDITNYLTAFKNMGFSKIYQRIDHELNLSNGGNNTYFVNNSTDMASELAAWKHIADLAHNIPGLTVKTIWNGSAGSIFNFSGMFPTGSGTHGPYCDLIGMDSYAVWNQPNNSGSNTSFQFPNMATVAKTNGIPICICETSIDTGSSGYSESAAVTWFNNLATELTSIKNSGVAIEFIAPYVSGQTQYEMFNGSHPTIITALRNLFITIGLSPS